MRELRQWVVATIIAAVLLFGASKLFADRLYRNDSQSMQTGYYWLTPGASVHRGDVVIACPPTRFALWAQRVGLLHSGGPCDGVETILKRVVAVAGDRVKISSSGVTINGRYLAGSKPQTLFHGIPIPHVPFGKRVLETGEVQLAGDRPDASWDSRFFGPTNHVLGRAKLLTFGDGD